MRYRLIHADVLDGLRDLADESVQCVVTSPPYWGLRDYGVAGQLGLERTPDEYVSRMVEVFREARRVLRADGTLWLNIGDTYGTGTTAGRQRGTLDFGDGVMGARQIARPGGAAKQLLGMPWRLALALQADGWYLRSDIIWSKPNPMPESVTDRPTKAHEYLFLLSESARYFYDADAIKEQCSPNTHARISQDVASQVGSARANGGTKTNGNMKAVVAGVNPKAREGVQGREKQNASMSNAICLPVYERNKRTVWEIPTEGYAEAHFATFPTALVEPCILAGSRVGDTILDPFNGSGTTGVVALGHQRNYVGIELNGEYVAMARRRLSAVAPMFAYDVDDLAKVQGENGEERG